MHAERTSRDSAAIDYNAIAKRLLGDALTAVENEDEDPIPMVTEALAALYVAVGESPKTVTIDAAGYPEWLAEQDEEPVCTCPPELLAQDGFKGDCPARGIAHG